MQTKPLFDGAFHILLPPNLIDASDLRQIPDNQEVFLHPSTNQSISIDILEFVDAACPEDAASYQDGVLKSWHNSGMKRIHFDAIAASNESTDVSITSVNNVPISDPDPYCSTIVILNGQQKVTKFNQTSEDVVCIHMGLYRFPAYEADVLVLVNDPVDERHQVQINPSGPNALDQFTSPTNGLRDEGPWNQQIIHNMLVSLRLNDPAIFGS